MPGRPPPGRAGRVWLAERIELAQRAGELLDHKQRLLRREQRRLAEVAERTGGEWRALAGRAETWSARALVGGGRDELARAASRIAPAASRLTWSSQAGVVYPTTAAVELPPPPALDGPSALLEASRACRLALEAAVRHAAALAARRRVDAELDATVRRLRAIRDRWIPRLRRLLADLEVRLEETEREEQARVRRIADPSPSTRDAP